MNKKFYITTPIYYVNDKPHLGHTYTTIAADVLARYHRMIGDQTFFLTGTDEHGAKIEETAKKAKVKPQQFVDEIAAKYQFAWDELNISNDNFIRTTNPKHIKAVQQALEFMYKKGDIYKGKYEGLYCKGCEQYKNEKDLVNGKCPEHKIKPEKMSEECYMFKLSKYAKDLEKKIQKDELKIRPIERKNEILSLYKEGLKDISFSRKKVAWGVPLPWDKAHTSYVWADAFLNYLTGIGWSGPPSDSPLPFGLAQGGRKGGELNTPSPCEGEGWGEVCPADVHLMSKDILRVHATIWPAMLLSLELSLPKQLFVHGFFLIDGQKMSKSIGNVIAPEELVKKYGVDGTRYLLVSATTFGHDGDVGWSKFDEKYNADLANGLGNLVARVLTMIEKLQINKGTLIKSDDLKLKDEIKEYNKLFNDISIDSALFKIWEVISKCDKYISDNKPWELIGEDNKKAGEILYNCLESIRIITWMLWPFIPETSEKIWQSLGLDPSKEMEKDFDKATKWGELNSGVQVKKCNLLFPRIT